MAFRTVRTQNDSQFASTFEAADQCQVFQFIDNANRCVHMRHAIPSIVIPYINAQVLIIERKRKTREHYKTGATKRLILNIEYFRLNIEYFRLSSR